MRAHTLGGTLNLFARVEQGGLEIKRPPGIEPGWTFYQQSRAHHLRRKVLNAVDETRSLGFDLTIKEFSAESGVSNESGFQDIMRCDHGAPLVKKFSVVYYLPKVFNGALLGKESSVVHYLPRVFSGVLTCALHLYANCCIKRWVDESNISHGVVDFFWLSGIEVLRAVLTFSAQILRHFISWGLLDFFHVFVIVCSFKVKFLHWQSWGLFSMLSKCFVCHIIISLKPPSSARGRLNHSNWNLTHVCLNASSETHHLLATAWAEIAKLTFGHAYNII